MGRLQHSVAALLLVLSIAAITGTTDAQDEQGPVVNIEGLGSVLGIMGQTAWTSRPIYKFFNIKYAEAPVGEQRFRAPVSVLPWSGVMNVTAPGRECPQSRTLSRDDPNPEDCLTLSVYSNDLQANRPVMVYIHGGAFVVGSAERFGPEYLLEKDIVLVVIQYRLGTLGFLSTGTERIPGNAAMYDVRESLEWVSRHIRHFGGNPQDVTIFGESAGGHAVSAMLHSPLVREDLFHRAIIQSGTTFMPWVTCQDPTEGSYDIARIIGCPMTSPNEIDNCLKQASVRDLVQAQDQHKKNEFSSPGYPKVAGACITIGGPLGNQNLMPVHPKESTYFRNVPIIFGMNSQEGLIFFNEYFQDGLNSQPIEFQNDWDFLEFVKTLNVKFGSAAFVDAVVGYELLSKTTWEEMGRANFSELVPFLIDIAGNLALKYGSVEEANRFARAHPGQIYLYNFDYVGPPSPMTPSFPYDVPNSVGHGDELKYLFPMSGNLGDVHVQMARIMVDLWTSFAITSVPVANNVIAWPPVSRPYGPYLRLVNPPERKEYFVHELTNTVVKARESNGALRMQFSLLSMFLALLAAVIRSVSPLPMHVQWVSIGLLSVCLLLLLSDRVSSQQSSPLVVIDGLGTVQGTRGRTAWSDREIYKFYNIRYAEAPIGQQRFRNPVSVKPWSGVFNAVSPGKPCPQLGLNSTSDANAEDCLTLSVYTQNITANRPVMVFIHGGAFVVGAASYYEPDYLLEKDIVLVSVQYRLGPLGFLSTGTANIPGNMAMLDMIMALEWVSSYIRFFGGDSTAVTIFGESAGGAAVSALLYSPSVRDDLFHRAIIQSGSIFSPWATCRSPKEGALDIARRVNCDRPAETMEDCLRSVPALRLMEAYEEHKNMQFNLTGYPDVSGACIVIGEASPFMPKHPKTLTRSAFRNVELMAGTTSQEGLMFWEGVYRYGLSYKPDNIQSSWELLQLIDTINERFGANSNDGSHTWHQIFSTFLSGELDRANFTELLPGLVDICGNLAIKAPVLQDVTRFAHANAGKVYLYSFDYSGTPSMYNFSAGDEFNYPYRNNSFHAEDLFYLFPLGQRLDQRDTEIAKTMVELWTSFAISGRPMAAGLKQNWNPVSHFHGPYVKINEECEERQNYFNEFSASTDKARNQRSAGTILQLSRVAIVLAIIHSVIKHVVQ
ncbi:uncharacterized protein LOC126567478 [Anopheles maculipalpis]|uniref:uncharacterized protein LOC126567478 n=1 Tax=Anopheles maculipalpis TaxID=1496333 RepID=UPI0021598743|nr:uncharacterized protein LOC126567478 [Anopheles maculipalpis]